MILTAMSVAIPETVPVKLMGIFGSITNFGIVIGLTAYMFLDQIVPTDEI